ncbi:MAG TPA: cation-translocating P-type ATPase [Chloroflexia bacterium]|nr:cation-translocating P-type ATPase [Chloroflexia bacterium]
MVIRPQSPTSYPAKETGGLTNSFTPTAWYSLEGTEVQAIVAGTSLKNGLDQAEAAQRLERYGPNELVEHGAKGPLRILWEQLSAIMVLILLAAAGLSLFLGKLLEAGSILAIVILFVLLGFLQEYRAEKAIAALKKLAVPNVRAYRDGILTEISARELVPGDHLLLEAGNVVPADVRLLESINLRIQEAALTGESEPVEKTAQALITPDLPLSERRNMAYMGTLVTYGRGMALVVETGMRTELGNIATLIQGVKAEMTPLQQRLDRLGKQLALAGALAALLIILIGLLAGETFTDMILTGISLAVAVIPEGLPAVVTITLALGAQRMLKRNALIRKLPAVETLGSITTICSDKTGTLTENRMKVVVLDVAGHRLELTESLKEDMPAADLNKVVQGQGTLLRPPQAVSMLLVAGALCNDARLQPHKETGQLHTLGDPTEGALLVAAVENGLALERVAVALPRVGELPFDSQRKRMTTVHARPALASANGLPREVLAVWGSTGLSSHRPYLAFTKGAVDELLELTNYVWDANKFRRIDEEQRSRIQAANNQLACSGMRVLGVAFRFLDHTAISTEDESDLIFVGLVGMIDPPRSEVKAAVQKCIKAGIRPVMITGDHPLTARYIARQLGIACAEDERVVTGAELDKLDEVQLDEVLAQTNIFARVIPEHKLRIVQALQKKGQVVAMTGDGVNDAPALKKADIGVAMGITGTDVSKEASDMVLRDDNFATIVAAVEEGRVIYDNLRRFINLSVAGNIGKVALMLLWPLPFYLLGLPLEATVALLPLQLLWLNLMTDGLLGLSMGVEPAEKQVMQRPPHSPKEGIFSGGMGLHVSWVGLFIALAAGVIGFIYYQSGSTYWQSMIFTTVAFLQVFQALATRSTYNSLFSIGIFTNRFMWGIIGLVSLLQLLALYTPLRIFLGLAALPLSDLLVCIGVGASLFGAVELEKIILRGRNRLNLRQRNF